MDHETVLAWVSGYEQAWRDEDLSAVERLFTPDAHYRVSPYADPLVGHDAIRSIWLSDEGEAFSCRADVVAVEGQQAVVRLLVRYGEPVRQEYLDLWLLRFAGDGRVSDFEEWAYWPDKPYLAPSDT
jgi:hypothetical protein